MSVHQLSGKISSPCNLLFEEFLIAVNKLKLHLHEKVRTEEDGQSKEEKEKEEEGKVALGHNNINHYY